jgi:hypothetical protein
VPPEKDTKRAMKFTQLEFRCLLSSPAMRSNAGMANREGDVEFITSRLQFNCLFPKETTATCKAQF